MTQMNEINLQDLCDNPTWKVETDFNLSYGDTIREKIDWIFLKLNQIAELICSSMGCGHDNVFIVVNSDDPMFGGMCKLVERWDPEYKTPTRPFEPLGLLIVTEQEVYHSEIIPKGSFLVIADYNKTHPGVQAGLLTFKNWIF